MLYCCILQLSTSWFFSIVDGHPDVLMESVMELTQRMSIAQRTELASVLASLDDMWQQLLNHCLEIDLFKIYF